MGFTIVSGNKPSSVALHKKSCNYSIYRNGWIKCRIFVLNLNVSKTKWDDAEKPIINHCWSLVFNVGHISYHKRDGNPFGDTMIVVNVVKRHLCDAIWLDVACDSGMELWRSREHTYIRQGVDRVEPWPWEDGYSTYTMHVHVPSITLSQSITYIKKSESTQCKS